MIDLEWDQAKRAANLLKHGVDFVEAGEVLADPLHVLIQDDRRDYGEDRFIVVGKNHRDALRVLVMSPRGENIRVISLRPATAYERGIYERIERH